MPIRKERTLNLPLNSDDMLHAQNQINLLFKDVSSDTLKVEGMPVESFSREYLIKMLYIYGEQFMENR